MRPTCAFRFHVSDHQANIHCPKCGSPTRLIPYTQPESPERPQDIMGSAHIEVLLDNIRSAYNVGSIFRSADGAGIKHIHICGITPTPDAPKTRKTALGAEFTTPWSQHWNSLELVEQKQCSRYNIWALENHAVAVPIFEIHKSISQSPVLLLVGNEVSGVDPGLLAKADDIFYIPMNGEKRSLNVSVAFGIAVYLIQYADKWHNKT
jgi:23S rRNA (guanosine2251-2'-O)-methyltransferase